MATPAWLRRRMSVPCTIYVRVPSGVDEYGNIAYVEQPVDTKCFFQPLSQQELQGGRAEEGLYLVHLAAEEALGTAASGFSRIVIRGYSMEVVGSVGLYPDLCSGQGHHIELTVAWSTA